ncbi:MAG: 3-deoxy-manno-octulosonate cytidylyltransferase [Proteobacteria bacterium]|nr:3-deoxy-manno-octulosonate cytidylyltransferase [Desulfobacteraceae bacterium]MBU3981386.1 3-deoxy-manno-octulosonate cytidylyltransferase [Pseudomonadota bacterium]MBU4013891.1 3-deoxy-manno-octulosonate cytidylyltransferase [Pseudomonadota bacterium]MBU4068176.1 3-deoxy-manno-octulosonate cytidylyltransferase [Pseudomonadota bacterium]MBU4101091.1 3-deoxy-manno-octulosonate cytidylyltransferase [Pseudomonadota bacterium]
MTIIGIIPARMGSSRFPGKPLAKIHGISMIEHVYKRSAMSKSLDDIYVATCDTEIKEAVEAFGGKVVMTKDTHERASDRVAEAMMKLEEEMNEKIDIVVMVQGDEPMVTPEMIEQSITPMLKDSSINVVNLMARMKTVEEFEDPNEVKVVVGLDGNALYFSREPIPSRKKGVADVSMFKQVCVIPFRRDYLLKFNSMPETPLERIESVDMMRILENGEQVRMVMTDAETLSVDTPEDLERVSKLMNGDELMYQYKGVS